MLKIPPPYLDMPMDCPECAYSALPDLIEGHLVEQHYYRFEQAERCLKDWIDEFPKDENGYPQIECESHGLMPADHPCCACYNEERKSHGEE